ncbi:hypothetical protein VULLAG_LOCUS20828 [Vulpes lagopus]
MAGGRKYLARTLAEQILPARDISQLLLQLENDSNQGDHVRRKHRS